MKNEDLYRKLAADGNQDAKAILDAEGEGAMPEEEEAEGESEEEELTDLQELAENVGRLVAKAEIHSEAGDHRAAGDAHFELGALHEGEGDHEKAKDAFKSAASSYQQHIGDLCSMSPEQIQAWHAKENAGK